MLALAASIHVMNTRFGPRSRGRPGQARLSRMASRAAVRVRL